MTKWVLVGLMFVFVSGVLFGRVIERSKEYEFRTEWSIKGDVVNVWVNDKLHIVHQFERFGINK